MIWPVIQYSRINFWIVISYFWIIIFYCLILVTYKMWIRIIPLNNSIWKICDSLGSSDHIFFCQVLRNLYLILIQTFSFLLIYCHCLHFCLALFVHLVVLHWQSPFLCLSFDCSTAGFTSQILSTSSAYYFTQRSSDYPGKYT